MYNIETPSRICLFGEHQDYLGLEVIVSAINLYFKASVTPRSDRQIHVRLRDRSLGQLGAQNPKGLYEEFFLDLDGPLNYKRPREYLKSAVVVMKKAGIEPIGVDITLDSEIPIGKGMCSSTTMILAYLTALIAPVDLKTAKNPAKMAKLAWEAEVTEFNEPGGMMDQYASAYGGLCHMDFSNGVVTANRLNILLDGVFILIDSLQEKDTIKVLSSSKTPTLEALHTLRQYGIHSITDFCSDKSCERYLTKLDLLHQQKVIANISDYAILQDALSMLKSGNVDDERLGALLNAHQANLKNGLGISTSVIDHLLETAMTHGAYGGKLNGSGGGGCMFVYAPKARAEEIIAAIRQEGYPAEILEQSYGLCVH